MTENEMVGWHHQLDGHGFGWTPGAGDGQGGLACCSSWGHKESDMTERLNRTELNTTALLGIVGECRYRGNHLKGGPTLFYTEIFSCGK